MLNAFTARLVRDLHTESVRERMSFERVRRAERQYGVRLRKVATSIGDIINAFPAGDPGALPDIERVLGRYAEMIEPWARATGAAMLADVSRRDETVWAAIAKDMSRSLREEIRSAPTGRLLQQYLSDQVRLIKSLPTEAGARVHKLTLEGLTTGSRAIEIAAEIRRSGHVTASRATLIARTEVARTSSGLVQARSEFVGSDAYTWRTSLDTQVRPSHQKMEGRVVKWNRPPTLDKMTGHAGCFPNCRCWPEPIIPDFKRR